MRYIAFDIETAKITPDGVELLACRPLGISCAATVTDCGVLRLWHGPAHPDGALAPQMAPEDCQELVEYLLACAQVGMAVLTWNGLFDFDVLQEECGPSYAQDACHLLARHDHIDIAFQMLCEKGFMVGLDTAAKGMGLPGKTEGMHGDLAPTMWAQGREQQDLVLEYVAQDVRTTADVYLAIQRARALRWVARSGKANVWLPQLRVNGSVRDARLLTVDECLQLPEPDTSWMSSPWPRSKFAGWLKGDVVEVSEL